jgi:hypothetical protein
MSVTNTWIVEQMDCYPQAEGQTDVVFIIHWRVNAANGNYTATSYGTVGVTYVVGAPYTPYADLTQNQVVGWVQASLGPEQVVNIEAALAINIANQINPPVVTPPLPWDI